MIDDKPNAIVIHVGTNDFFNRTNHEDIARSIINIGLDCKNNGINEVLILSILVKKNPNLITIVHRVSDMLRDLCEKMVLVLFVMILLQLIIYGKMVFNCRT